MQPLPAYATFACGGAAACVAELATLPIDTTKVRLQLMSARAGGGAAPSMLAVARGIVADEGVRGLFKGLAPALQRQIVFASLRIGLYADISERLREPGAASLSLGRKIAAGLLSGAIGITIANVRPRRRAAATASRRAQSAQQRSRASAASRPSHSPS